MVLHMNTWILVLLLVSFIQSLVILAGTNSDDYNGLITLTLNWGNKPSSWQSNDPCGGWDGVQCDSNSRVTSIRWASMNLTGQLTGDIADLSELQYLDLSYNTGLTGSLPALLGNLKNLINLSLVGCRFTGLIPDSIGSLSQLSFLALNSNRFVGTIPSSIGNLTKLTYLDLSENQLSGTIPVSNATMPGLDNLLNAKHFHFGVNRLSGDIPETLFNSKMNLLHVLFDNNRFTGSIPSSLVLVQTLEAVRFDNNTLTGYPTNLNNLTNLQELHLSNNKLSGVIPDLSGLQQLAYVDMSNNSFDSSTAPGWFSSLTSLNTLIMENSRLNGPLPSTLFGLSSLQEVKLKGNAINGTLELGNSFGDQLELIDLQSNLIDDFTPSGTYSFQLILVSNPFCTQTGASSKWPKYCTIQQSNSSPYSTPTNNCTPGQCSSGQTSSPNCKCAHPYTGTLVFRAPTFSNLGISSYYKSLQDALMATFKNNVPVDSVSLSNATRDQFAYLRISLAVFPDGVTQFNTAQVSFMAFLLSNQFLKTPDYFGPYYFIANDYVAVADGSSGKKKSVAVGVIAGVAVGVSVLLLLLIGAGFYALRQKKRAEKATSKTDPFATWDKNKSFGDVPQLKGTRSFTFDELKKCTQDFSDANNIGAGGYGKVYKGVLPGGKVVAIKRAQMGSMQGAVEFKNEIELLSRVHHKNLVNLVGFCYEQGEQMLVYEFMPNGTLMENLAGKSRYNVDWFMRLKIALGAARGLAYLHELADPPIIHRDIKSVNILLDERLNAKVADFGLSKAFGDDQSYVTTQVKGTLGYLDPEYYMTNQLTEKSDVYSFGVVMLELVSGRRPIQNGQYIVREVKTKMDVSRDLYNLHELLDPAIADTTISLVGFEKFVDLALRCVDESAATRPRMGEVVREIEYIMELGGINPNTDSAPTSSNYGEPSTGTSPYPYSDQSLFDYSGSVPSRKIEPQ